MSDFQTDRPISQLLSGLVSDVSGLFRKEIELAKAEVGEKISEVSSAGQQLAIGGVLAIGAIGVMLAAIVAIISAILVAMGVNPTVAHAISAVIVTIAVGAVAYTFINRGVAAIKGENMSLDRTVGSLQRDVETVKEKF
ncbi:MAG: phage holin family protein [Devosia sp.]|nr:phage holin family protein [Devosia sp.]